MKRIYPGGAFVHSGAIVLDERELGVVIHALFVERERVAQAGGNQYGPMDLAELDTLIVQLRRQCQKERGA